MVLALMLGGAGAQPAHHADVLDLKAKSVCVRLTSAYTACYDAPREAWAACFGKIYAEDVLVADPGTGFLRGRTTMQDALAMYPADLELTLSIAAQKARFVPGSHEAKIQCAYEGFQVRPFGDQIWGFMLLGRAEPGTGMLLADELGEWQLEIDAGPMPYSLDQARPPGSRKRCCCQCVRSDGASFDTRSPRSTGTGARTWWATWPCGAAQAASGRSH
jgi:hypothetical protein